MNVRSAEKGRKSDAFSVSLIKWTIFLSDIWEYTFPRSWIFFLWNYRWFQRNVWNYGMTRELFHSWGFIWKIILRYLRDSEALSWDFGKFSVQLKKRLNRKMILNDCKSIGKKIIKSFWEYWVEWSKRSLLVIKKNSKKEKKLL